MRPWTDSKDIRFALESEGSAFGPNEEAATVQHEPFEIAGAPIVEVMERTPATHVSPLRTCTISGDNRTTEMHQPRSPWS